MLEPDTFMIEVFQPVFNLLSVEGMAQVDSVTARHVIEVFGNYLSALPCEVSDRKIAIWMRHSRDAVGGS